MKNYKGNMLLIELVIVIMFFSLSQVVIVQVFAEAHKRTIHNSKMNSALMQVENMIERLTGEEEPGAVLQNLGFAGGDGSYRLPGDGYVLEASVRKLSQPGGDMITVSFKALEGSQEMFTLPSMQYFSREEQNE